MAEKSKLLKDFGFLINCDYSTVSEVLNSENKFTTETAKDKGSEI